MTEKRAGRDGSMPSTITVALAGNPNSGKTTIFNNLTGARYHVGNYPGVTVEKKLGRCRRQGVDLEVVDLPGTYSLTAYSLEERAARDFIIEQKPDVVVDIIDASNLERNLYLAVQLMELSVPLVLAFNMSDVAAARGIEFDLPRLSALLGVPIVPTVGHKAIGMDALLDATLAVAAHGASQRVAAIHYGPEVEEELEKLLPFIVADPHLSGRYPPRWLALKLLENDSDVRSIVRRGELLHAADVSMAHLERVFGEAPELVIADRRYGFISGACQETVRSTIEARHTFSDKVDAVLTNRVLGFPVFLALMYLVYYVTFTVGDAPMGWLENAFGWLANTLAQLWPKDSQSALKSLLVDGIIGGVGNVVVFLPNVLLLFLAIALLEDSGYMARAAFIMDHLMHRIGLHGKSFIPLLLGFGCSVPAIMATRILENRKDRMTTILVTPLMSCSARLPIYALIIPAFFLPQWHAPMLWLIYVIGIGLAMLGARLLRASLFRGETTPFVMELPPYRVPTLKGLLIHMWERAGLYLKKAGTVILGASIVLWAMTTFPRKTEHRDLNERLLAVRSDYLAQVKALNVHLGLGPDSELLTQAIQAELDVADACARYYHGQPELNEAIRKAKQTIAELERATDGAVLTKFLDIREAVEAARRTFQAHVEERRLEPSSPEYMLWKHHVDEVVAQIKARNPAMYVAAAQYLDKIKPMLDDAEAQALHEKRAQDLAHSLAGRVGRAFAPILATMGFDWKIGTALIGAFAAKEVFVAQLGIVYSVGNADEDADTLRSQLRRNYSPLVGFCIMLFCLVGAPCIATIAVTRRETNSWRWALFQWSALTALAYVLTSIVYQAGRLAGWAG